MELSHTQQDGLRYAVHALCRRSRGRYIPQKAGYLPYLPLNVTVELVQKGLLQVSPHDRLAFMVSDLGLSVFGRLPEVYRFGVPPNMEAVLEKAFVRTAELSDAGYGQCIAYDFLSDCDQRCVSGLAQRGLLRYKAGQGYGITPLGTLQREAVALRIRSKVLRKERVHA